MYMPHVSKRKVDKEVLDDIHSRLIEVLASFNEGGDIRDILDDLLTKTERTMIAKRLAIAIMLHRGYTFGLISHMLKVSEATISVMRERMDRGGRGFQKALSRLNKEKKLDRLFAKLDRAIRMFALPPVLGKGRWRFLQAR